MVNSGQCGNQLGFELIRSLWNNFSSSDHEGMNDSFFTESKRGRHIARAICLDTEPKAIHDCIKRARLEKKWRFDSKCIVYRHGGAGNNWALGYKMCDAEFLEASLDSIRIQLELCDRVPTFLLLNSIGGGTGSGLGTKITEAIADEVCYVSIFCKVTNIINEMSCIKIVF